jgi:release factor glutamine methyltransferase
VIQASSAVLPPRRRLAATVRFESRNDEIELRCDGVMAPSAYTRLLADHLGRVDDREIVDVGTGSGVLGILAMLRGAARVYLSDINSHALRVAVANASHNGITRDVVALPAGPDLTTLPEGLEADVIVSNPASLPMRRRDTSASPYYAGPDGRDMIENIVRKARQHLKPNGRLLLVHTSLADRSKTDLLLESLGLVAAVVAEAVLPFRSFYDRDWIDALGGISSNLYHLRNGQPVEHVQVLEACAA